MVGVFLLPRRATRRGSARRDCRFHMEDTLSEEQTPQEPVEQDEGATPDEQLGEAGLKALESERAARKAAEKERASIAARLKELEDRDKTDAERAAEELAETKRQLAEATAAALRSEVAAAKGVPASLLSGSTQEELEASADALIAYKGEPAKPRLHLPGEGQQPRVGAGSTAEQFAAFMQDKL